MNYKNYIIIIKDFSLSQDYDHSNQKHYYKYEQTESPEKREHHTMNQKERRHLKREN